MLPALITPPHFSTSLRTKAWVSATEDGITTVPLAASLSLRSGMASTALCQLGEGGFRYHPRHSPALRRDAFSHGPAGDEGATLITDHAFAELGLPIDASEKEVKAAWRRLVSQWHPDRNDSAAAVAKIQRINQAFEAIRRARQSPASEAATPPTAAPEPAYTAPPAAAPQQQQQQPPRPPIRRKLKLTLEEAAAGCIKPLRGKFTETCTTCDGAGHQMLGGNCKACGGSGAVQQRSAWFGWPSVRIECEECLGGGIARRVCPTCEGSCKCEISYQVQVRIPHGVRDGDLLHVDARRAGNAAADLEIQVQIAAHALFQLDEDGTVRCEVPVNGFAWIANRAVQVPTLAGLHTLQLSRDLQTYRLAGQGFPRERRGTRGDQVVTIVPVFPAQFSTDQDILLDQLIATTGRASGAGSSERLQAWDKSVKAWERARTAAPKKPSGD